MAELPRSQELPVLPIDGEEWDFRSVPDQRVREAFVYEYCRSAGWLTRAVKERVHPCKDQDVRFIPFEDLYVRKINIDVEAARRAWNMDPPNRSKKGAKQGAPKAPKKPVYEISARLTPKTSPLNPFIYHDRIFTLGMGFPDRPYQSNPDAFATVEIYEGMELPGVYDIKTDVQKITLKADSPVWHLAKSKFRDKAFWLNSEPNGQPIKLPGNDQSWRKFALAIDFSLSDEELKEAFGSFLNQARENYDLKMVEKSERRARRVPPWLTLRYARDGLSALGAYRLIMAASGDEEIAFRGAREQLRIQHSRRGQRWNSPFMSKKELSRAAKRYPDTFAKLFGADNAFVLR